jgi:hypothetical protein
MLKVGQPGDTIVPSFFYAVDLPPLDGSKKVKSGASLYREHIIDCAPYLVELGDSLQVKPGNMQGPTRQGVQELIDQDPSAVWDNASQSVIGSVFGTSPRVVKIALFDPRYTPKSGRDFVIVAKLAAFFIERVDADGGVTGVLTGAMTQGEPCATEDPTFLTSVHLVL